MGFEPTTSCLGSKHSTTELHPLVAAEPFPNILQTAWNSKAHHATAGDYSSPSSSAMRLSCTLTQYSAHSTRVSASLLPET